ncbi:MAG: STAS domain-containing protein [Bacteroidales bacterium]|nr:STAS domain-containing protein [Bacteroidales bacterium]
MAKKTEKKPKENSTLFEIKDGITISNVSDIRKKMLKYIEGSKTLRVKIDKTEQLDLSGIQLLYSLQKSCIQQGKKIQFDINLAEETMELLKNSGFNNIKELDVQ